MESTHAVRLAVLASPSARFDELTARVLAAAPEMHVSRAAHEWPDLIDRDGSIPADILLLDVQLGDDEPVHDLVRRARSAGVRVITVSSLDDPRSVVRDMAAGADAALRKSDSTSRLVDQIRLAASRGRLIAEQ